MTNRTKLIVAVAVIVMAVVAAVLYLAQSTQTPPATPEVITTASPTATSSPSLASPGGARVYEEHIQESEARNPVLAHVPKATPHWMVELVDPPEDDKVALRVTVFVDPDQDKQAKINEQRPHIERWLQSIGQPPGTCILKFRTEVPDTY